MLQEKEIHILCILGDLATKFVLESIVIYSRANVRFFIYYCYYILSCSTGWVRKPEWEERGQWEGSSSSRGGVKERREERVGGFGAWTRGVGG